jgi:hypothetical protein
MNHCLNEIYFKFVGPKSFFFGSFDYKFSPTHRKRAVSCMFFTTKRDDIPEWSACGPITHTGVRNFQKLGKHYSELFSIHPSWYVKSSVLLSVVKHINK